ncbi:MAG: GAF domain-containing protein, partial [Thermoanaerobaculia bacterium]|nr:GAF domain-containing protein [Thermoanaerobaculia bacterium]
MSSTADPTPADVESQHVLPPTFLLGQNRVLSLVAQGADLGQILLEFCHVVEFALPETRCCVMMLDPSDRTLRVGAAPSLPGVFVEAIDGLAAGSAPGSCSAAIHRGETVMTTDMRTGSVWEGLRDTVEATPLTSCWSAPIRGIEVPTSKGREEVQILGTVAFYFDAPRQPARRDLMVLELAAALAGRAITAGRVQERGGRHEL